VIQRDGNAGWKDEAGNYGSPRNHGIIAGRTQQ
jgi:hypothetical protein